MVIPTPIGEFGQFGSGSTERADFGGDFVGFAIAVLISANQIALLKSALATAPVVGIEFRRRLILDLYENNTRKDRL